MSRNWRKKAAEDRSAGIFGASIGVAGLGVAGLVAYQGAWYLASVVAIVALLLGWLGLSMWKPGQHLSRTAVLEDHVSERSQGVFLVAAPLVSLLLTVLSGLALLRGENPSVALVATGVFGLVTGVIVVDVVRSLLRPARRWSQPDTAELAAASPVTPAGRLDDDDAPSQWQHPRWQRPRWRQPGSKP